VGCGDLVGVVRWLLWSLMKRGGSVIRLVSKASRDEKIPRDYRPSTAINQCFVRLADVNVLGVDDLLEGLLRVHMEYVRVVRGCPHHVKDRPEVELVDLPVYGHPTRQLWYKRGFGCPEVGCPMGFWTEEDPRIASQRLSMTDRSGRWITEQVGRRARSVSEVAKGTRL
jgi:hypothetical protein